VQIRIKSLQEIYAKLEQAEKLDEDINMVDQSNNRNGEVDRSINISNIELKTSILLNHFNLENKSLQ
jgi:hypothetical protein